MGMRLSKLGETWSGPGNGFLYILISGHVPLTTNTLISHFCTCAHQATFSMNNKIMQECRNEY